MTGTRALIFDLDGVLVAKKGTDIRMLADLEGGL